MNFRNVSEVTLLGYQTDFSKRDCLKFGIFDVLPQRGFNNMVGFGPRKQPVTELRRQGWKIAHIAEQLNKESLRTTRHGYHNGDSVRQFIFRFEQDTRQPDLSTDEWWIHSLAREISVPWGTLNGWRRKGWLVVRKVKGLRKPCWIAWADAEELARLRRLRDYRSGNKPYPTELTTPKIRSEN